MQYSEANILQDFGFAAYFGNFQCWKTFQSIFRWFALSSLSSITHIKLFYPSKISKVAAQDYFSAKVATRLLINYGIRKHQKLQKPVNTNRLHWSRELKCAAENTKITHHDGNFEFFFNMTAASIMLVWQTERVNIGTVSCFICHGSFTIQSRIILHGKKI